MNPQKFDAALLGELDNVEAGRYSVLVRTRANLSNTSRQFLLQCGSTEDTERSTVFALNLDRTQIDALSDQNWVLSISLGRKLRPLG